MADADTARTRCASPWPVSVAVKSSNAASALKAGASRRQSRKFAGATARLALSARVSQTTIRLSGIGVGQRLQHAAVQHREDRGVGADAERERADGRQRQQRVAEAEPEGEAEVGHEVESVDYAKATSCSLALVLLTPPAGRSSSLYASQTAPAANPLAADVDRLAAEINPQVVAWRRDFHQHPELGNRETRTAKVIADELRKLGYEVKTGVADTGVVGVLKAARPGPVVALRSDMDALPVTEQVDCRSSRRRRRSGTARKSA